MLMQLAISAHQFLAQVTPFDDAPAPTSAPAPRRPMSLTDLQQGFSDVHSGKVNDNSFRNGVLIFFGLIALFLIIIHFRQRKTEVVQPDNLRKLGRELGRVIHFPFGSKIFLKWVAKSTRTPFVSLLLSEKLFNRCISEWQSLPTFSAARHWGRSRLDKLRAELFESAPAPVEIQGEMQPPPALQ